MADALPEKHSAAHSASSQQEDAASHNPHEMAGHGHAATDM